MSYLDHDGLAYFKFKLDRTFIADIVFDDGDILLYGGDGTLLKTVVQEGTVTQKKSTTNKEYPILLCWDADAEEDQTMKTVWYGLDARINPKFGYLYARRYYTEHPSYERTSVPSARTEWHHIFTDAVSAPMGEVYEYLDRNSDGGEHRMELRLYGNPLSQYVDTPNHNEATDAVSIGVGATRGDTLTFFGYCPSTPIYLENGTTMRKSTVRGDQYGKDIITRDWLNLNGSVTGLVHTYMDETIDGYKTFLKTVTINSGDNNNKAGLYVQGDANLHSNAHIYGNETVDGKLTANGTAEIKGGSGSTPSLTVTGNEYISGNSNVHGSLDVDTNLNVDGTSNLHGAVTAGNGLAITGNETVTGNLTVGGTTTTEDLTVTDDATIGDDLTVNGDANVAGTINKKVGNTTTEYVQYITNQDSSRKLIAANLIDTTKGLAYNSSTGKIYINAANNKGIAFDGNGKIYVDFSQIDDNTKAAILDGLDIQIPLKTNIDLVVNPGASNDTDSYALDYSTRVATPFTTIQKAVTWASSKLALGTKNVFIKIANGTYQESVSLPEVNTSSGHIELLPLTDGGTVLITSPVNSNGCYPTCVYANSGACKWVLRHIDFDLRFGINTSSSTHTAACVLSGIDGAIIDLIGCNFFLAPELVNGSRRTEITGGPQACSLINADGGTINLYPDDSGSAVTFYLPTTNTAGVSITVLNAARNGRIAFRRRAAATTGYYTCKGSCNVFMHAWQGGNTALIGSNGAQTQFVVADGETVTGKKYVVETGAYVLAPSGGFPGASEGSTVDTTKACWISGV